MASVSGGWAQSLGASERQGAEVKEIVVGAHPWVYAEAQPNYDITPILPTIFADMQYAGMDGIELMHNALLPADAVARISALSEKHNLPIIGCSFMGNMWDRKQHKAILKDAEQVISSLAQVGGRTLGTTVGWASADEMTRKTPEQLDAQADLLRRIIAICQAHGIVLNLHNHTYEVVNDQYDLKGTLARLPDVKLGPDINWLVRAGVDPVAFIRQYNQRIVFLHLRDQDADRRWTEAMGDGVTDFAGISEALHEVHFQGDLVIELAHEQNYHPTRPLRDSLKISRDYIRRVFGC